MKKTMTTEFYSSVKHEDGDEWYITVQKVEWPECTFYRIQKEKSGDSRSKSNFQVDEDEIGVLLELLKAAMEGEE